MARDPYTSSSHRGYARVRPPVPMDLQNRAGVTPSPAVQQGGDLQAISDTLDKVLAQMSIIASTLAVGGTYIAKRNVIDVIDSVVITNIAASGSGTLITITVPSGAKFRMTHLGTFIRDAAALGQLTWSLKESGNPVPPYNLITTLNGVEGDPRLVVSPRLLFVANNVITLTVSNAALVAFDAGGHIKGEIYVENYA